MKLPLAAIAAGVLAAPALAQPEYTVQEITGWSPAELATLPVFHRWAPGDPPGAWASFDFEARRGTVAVGQVDSTYGVTAAVVQGGTQTLAPALGVYYWEDLYWDGTDWHFQNGRVQISRALDVNGNGVVVGESTLDGIGDAASGYVTHAVLFSTTDPAMTDLTPGADRAAATGINRAGEICGWTQTAAGQRMFRRAPGGTMTEIDTIGGWANRPAGINADGRIAGVATANLSYTGYRAVVSESGSALADLGLPPTGPSTDAAAYDLNDADLVVGASWDNNQTYEHFAAIWQRQSGGTWDAYDLNEILADNPVDALLENAVAVDNSGRIIATGRTDGSDVFGSSLYYLTPVGVPSCPADLTNDGALSLDDLDAFVAGFLAGDPIADLDANGTLNLDDLGLFVDSFLAGCP